MNHSIIKLSLLGVLSASLLITPTAVLAKDTNAPAPAKKLATESQPKKNTKLPFHGKLKAVDQTAKTISVGEMTLQITSATMITKADKPAKLEDGVIGEAASGSYLKGEDGKLTVSKLRFGPKPAAPEKTAKPGSKKEKTN